MFASKFAGRLLVCGVGNSGAEYSTLPTASRLLTDPNAQKCRNRKDHSVQVKMVGSATTLEL
jgi:hypothetical protein